MMFRQLRSSFLGEQYTQKQWKNVQYRTFSHTNLATNLVVSNSFSNVSNFVSKLRENICISSRKKKVHKQHASVTLQ